MGHEENMVVETKAREIAAALSNPLLGVTWTLEEEKTKEYSNGAWIKNGELELHLYVGYHSKGRLEISGSFNGLSPYLPYRDREKTEITVAVDKSAVAVARDVERRLLPPYKKMLAAASASKDGDLARRKKIMDILTELTALVPGGTLLDADEFNGPSSARPWVTSYSNPYYDLHKMETYGEDVHSELRVSVDLAAKLLKAINPNTGATPPKT
jgi:hypothetical protein